MQRRKKQKNELERWAERAAEGIIFRPDQREVERELLAHLEGQGGGPGPHLPGYGAGGRRKSGRWSRWGTRRKSGGRWPGSTGHGWAGCGG